MESGRLHASPVGQLLVERGLMSQDQLEDALLEQRVSRKRLGAILIENRVVTAQDLTSALQAQVREIAGPDAEPEEPMRPEAPARKRRFFRRQDRVEEDAPSSPRAATDRELLALTESQNDELRRELARHETDLELLRVELGSRESRIAELESRLETLEQEQAFLAEALQLEIQALESDLATLGAARSAGVAEAPTGLNARSASAPFSPATYLTLTPDADGGHTLRECRGDAPPVGGEVEYGGRRYVVASHRRSPLGLDNRVCIHLQQN